MCSRRRGAVAPPHATRRSNASSSAGSRREASVVGRDRSRVSANRSSPDEYAIGGVVGKSAARIAPASAANDDGETGRAHVWTPVTNAHLVCRLLLEKKKNK